jgi:hypothetical protein
VERFGGRHCAVAPGPGDASPGPQPGPCFAGKPDPRADGPSRRAPGKGAPRPPASRGTPTALPALRASNNHRARPPWDRAGGSWLRDGRAPPRCSRGSDVESGGPQRRSFHAAGGWRNPMASWSPLVRSAGSAAARFGEHGTVWAIRKFPSIVHGYQSPIPRLARTAVGVPTNRPRSIDAAHDLEDDVSARLRGSGRDQTVTAARSRTDRQPD